MELILRKHYKNIVQNKLCGVYVNINTGASGVSTGTTKSGGQVKKRSSAASAEYVYLLHSCVIIYNS
jgi:hypothetical protein